MSLPKIDTPIYELDLPLCGKHIRFRPFLVKEQKNLLMALEADDGETITNNIRQVLNNCTLTPNVNIDDIPIVDIEYYFLNLRARSVGEIVEAKYRCNNEVEGKDCGNIMEAKVNVLEIKVDRSNETGNLIKLNDNIAVKMKYPSFQTIKKAAETSDAGQIALEMIIDSIDSVYDGQQEFPASESTREELLEFVESLSQSQFNKIEEFFENLPKLDKTLKLKCSKCAFEHEILFEGLESFFD